MMRLDWEGDVGDYVRWRLDTWVRRQRQPLKSPPLRSGSHVTTRRVALDRQPLPTTGAVR